MTLDDLKRNIERSILRRQVLSRELEPKITVTEADARAEYEPHKSEYGKSASVHLQEIVVPDSAQAQDVVRRARAGEDFGDLARALSTAGSRANGGELGQVAPGDMNPELAKIVGALPAGGVSDPIALENGFRIVRVVAKEDATTTPYEELREEISKRLSQQRMASVYEEYVAGLRKASEKTTQTTVSEVSLTVPNVPTSNLSGPGLGPAPGTPRARRAPRRPPRTFPPCPASTPPRSARRPRHVRNGSRPPRPRHAVRVRRRRPRRPVRRPDRRGDGPRPGPSGAWRVLGSGAPMPFFERVYEAVRAIPRGRVATYGQVAQLVGVPRGARAVGWALRALDPRRARAVPWHRVVGAGGRISPRAGAGPVLQRRRLHAEGVGFRSGRVDLRRHGLLS